MAENSEERHRRAWERLMEAERREVEDRCRGQLSKALSGPILPGETRTELERLGEEDRALAEKGLVELKDAEGVVRFKHVDDLVPEDREDRARAQGARVAWLTERTRRLRITRG